MKNLSGKRVLVCGSASGIGAATAKRLGEEGAHIVLGDVNIEGAEAVAQDIRDQGGVAAAWQYDQADDTSTAGLVEHAIDHLGSLDGLFANVADLQIVHQDGDLLSNDSALWARTLQVNVTGTAMLLRAALPHMLERGSGTFVLTSSDAGVVGEPERPAYAASKAAVNSLCRHVASKWGKAGIRCNVVSPGLIMTEQLDANMSQEVKDWALKGARSNRHGRSEDVASAVAFLLSDEGEWINGQVWRVNGGVSFAN